MANIYEEITNPTRPEGEKLLTPTFNKKEIEGIAKGVCFARFDIDEPPQGLVEYEPGVDDIDEAIEHGEIPASGTYEELTDSQIAGFRKILKKAIYDGVVDYSGNYQFLNYIGISPERITACFGCLTASGEHNHEEFGTHLEVSLESDSKALYVHLYEL